MLTHAPIQGQRTHITPPGESLTAPPRNLAFFVHLCLSTLQGPKYASKRLSISLNFMSLTPPPKAKLSNKAPLQGPLGPCLPPRSSGSSVVGLEVSCGAQNPVRLLILLQPSSWLGRAWFTLSGSYNAPCPLQAPTHYRHRPDIVPK